MSEQLFSPKIFRRITRLCCVGVVFIISTTAYAGDYDKFKRSGWRTDFSNSLIEDVSEFLDGGPGKDGIPSIDKPSFMPIGKIDDIADTEPVISLEINGDVRGYPLRVLIWHEIVNDVVGGVPVVVTYCPLCNSAVVFDRRLKGETLTFGVSGLLRYSDMIMYDRQSESWWQQFLGEALVGVHAGQKLKIIASRVESFALLQARFPKAKILVPNNSQIRPYGVNPYVGYDTSAFPFLFKGDYQGTLPPLAHVVVVDEKSWAVEDLRKKGEIIDQDIVIRWTPGQNSALDSRKISKGRDIGNIIVQKQGKDIPYHITFAFVYDTFVRQNSLKK